jgi:hypothetical protein
MINLCGDSCIQWWHFTIVDVCVSTVCACGALRICVHSWALGMVLLRRMLFFTEKTVTAPVYMDIKVWLLTKILINFWEQLMQVDGALPFHINNMHLFMD